MSEEKGAYLQICRNSHRQRLIISLVQVTISIDNNIPDTLFALLIISHFVQSVSQSVSSCTYYVMS